LDQPLYPKPQIANQLIQSPSADPLITTFSLFGETGNQFTLKEVVYDFAVTVLRTAKGNTSTPPFSVDMDEERMSKSQIQPTLVSGVLQIGLSDARRKQDLARAIKDILLLTTLIIVVGALGAHLLTLRITKPLRNLAGVAQQVAEGRSPEPLTLSTHDEIGQLTSMFNLMTRSLQERNIAITANQATIKHQLGQ
jgi:methyl-accepting chemotaxis protein